VIESKVNKSSNQSGINVSFTPSTLFVTTTATAPAAATTTTTAAAMPSQQQPQ
jgi:hypothetical protein